MAIHHFNELRTIIRSLLALNASVELSFIICLEKKKESYKKTTISTAVRNFVTSVYDWL